MRVTVGMRTPRARFIWVGLAGFAALALAATGITLMSLPRNALPASERIIGLGFEDIVDHADKLPQLEQRLNEVRATSVSVSVGRTDWTAFPWPDHTDHWSAAVRDTGRDYVAEAIHAVGKDAAGKPRSIIAVIDVLVQGWITRDPSIAGVSATGERSTSFPSVTALSTGVVGKRLVALVNEVCQRYSPTAVSLTELFLDTYTFGGDDLRLYRAFTGASDWPRTPSGAIDTSDPSIGAWRSHAVTALVTRAASAAHSHGVKLLMEVRASWNGTHRDPGQDGQDYSALLAVADRLVIWGYFGLNNRSGASLEDVARSLPDAERARFVMSVGLWANSGTISASDLSQAVTASAAGGVPAVWVTPASLMDDALWKALAAAWKR